MEKKDQKLQDNHKEESSDDDDIPELEDMTEQMKNLKLSSSTKTRNSQKSDFQEPKNTKNDTLSQDYTKTDDDLKKQRIKE